MQSTSTTKTDRLLEDKMLAAAGDQERVTVLGCARQFKRSWIELAEALTAVLDKGSWERWGYKSFDSYCKKELKVTPSTAAKLTGSFRFLKASAPKIIERTMEEPNAPVPDMKVIDFVSKAERRGAADDETMRSIHKAAFDEGISAPKLAKRFKEVAFPLSKKEQTQKVLVQLESTAKRLASLLADADALVPDDVGSAVEEKLGALLECLAEQKQPSAEIN